MENKLTKVVIFAALPILLFIVSAVTLNATMIFAFALSLPTFIVGIRLLNKQLKPQLQRVKK
jgi:hypothetical protein